MTRPGQNRGLIAPVHGHNGLDDAVLLFGVHLESLRDIVEGHVVRDEPGRVNPTFVHQCDDFVDIAGRVR